MIAVVRRADVEDDRAAATVAVAIEKLADVCPPATTTCAGGCASDVSLLTIVTSMPPLGAGRCSVIVPVTVFPPATLSVLSAMLKRSGTMPNDVSGTLVP